jgi:hypothetical protein
VAELEAFGLGRHWELDSVWACSAYIALWHFVLLVTYKVSHAELDVKQFFLKKTLDILVPIRYSDTMLLTTEMSMRETFAALPYAQQERVTRFWFKSPCYFVRTIDVAVHITLPELIDGFMPVFAAWLRSESPRWGRSWRSW